MTIFIYLCLMLLGLFVLFLGLAEAAHHAFGDKRCSAYGGAIGLFCRVVFFVLLLFIAFMSSHLFDGLVSLNGKITQVQTTCFAAGGQP